MNGFSIYKTTNFNLQNISEWQFPTQKSLNYIWFDNRILTHFFYEPKADANIKLEFLVKLIIALTPTIEAELSMNKKVIEGSNTWKIWIIAEDYNVFLAFIRELFTQSSSCTNQPISVLICTNNQVDYLRNCILALQCCFREYDEIIVVDYSQVNNYTEILLKNFSGIRYIKETNPSLASARNMGIRLAKNSIVAFTNDHFIVGEKWLDEIRNSFANRNVMAISGIVLPLEINSATKPYFNRNWCYNRGYVEQVFDYTYFTNHIENRLPFWGITVSGNMAFRKSIFDKTSYFNENLKDDIIDEVLTYTILSKGWECVYQPKVYVYEQANLKSTALKKHLFNHMKAQTFWLFQNDICNPICRNLPIHYYRRLKHCLLGGKLETISGLKTEVYGIIAGIIVNLRN